MTYIELAIKIDEGTYNNFVRNGYSRADVIALHNALLNGTSLEQEPSRDMEEIREVMSCDADAETKCKMIYNILTAKPHYFEKQEPCEDAISRTDLIRKLQAWDAKATGIPNYALGIIKELPSVTPKEKAIEQEPCEDAISRQAVIKVLINNGVHFGDMVKITSDIKDLPPVNPQEPKTGHWIRISPAEIYECSECGQNVMTSDICAYKFCHGCGARMVEPKESEVRND